jgi:hypothetical protein
MTRNFSSVNGCSFRIFYLRKRGDPGHPASGKKQLQNPEKMYNHCEKFPGMLPA